MIHTFQRTASCPQGQGLFKKKAKFFSKPTNLEAITDAWIDFLQNHDNQDVQWGQQANCPQSCAKKGHSGATVRGLLWCELTLIHSKGFVRPPFEV
jgi:hypothetical protein